MDRSLARWLGCLFVLAIVTNFTLFSELFDDRNRFHSSLFKNSLSDLEEKLENLQNDNDLIKVQVSSIYEKLKIYADKKRLEHARPPARISQAPKNDPVDEDEVLIPILVIACNRVTVNRALDSILTARKHLPASSHPIVVSQDCGHAGTKQVIERYKRDNDHISVIYQTDLSDFPDVKKNMQGYYKLSRHYKFALQNTFQMFPSALGTIIVEDDLLVSHDFIDYFRKFSPLLNDPSENLFCLSTWNDNGKDDQIEQNPELVYRTDFFGGLGWMLSKKIWDEEFSSKWPTAFWDDWIRNVEQRKGRQCIHPEVPRTSTFGKVGVSNGQFFDQYLGKIHEFHGDFSWKQFDLEKIRKNEYDEQFFKKIEALPKAELSDFESLKAPEVRLIYSTKKEFEAAARKIGVMTDLKAGVPRMGYFGVVTALFKNKRVYITPPNPRLWEYHTDW